MLNVSTLNVKTNNGICKCKFYRFSLKLAFNYGIENSVVREGVKNIQVHKSLISRILGCGVGIPGNIDCKVLSHHCLRFGGIDNSVLPCITSGNRSHLLSLVSWQQILE